MGLVIKSNTVIEVFWSILNIEVRKKLQTLLLCKQHFHMHFHLLTHWSYVSFGIKPSICCYIHFLLQSASAHGMLMICLLFQGTAVNLAATNTMPSAASVACWAAVSHTRPLCHSISSNAASRSVWLLIISLFDLKESRQFTVRPLKIETYFLEIVYTFQNFLFQESTYENTVKCHYNACHYNATASLRRSILGSQTAPSWPSPSGSAHRQKVWNQSNHRSLIGYCGNDTPLFPYKWIKTKVSHLLVMSIQSIHDWSSIKHTDYSSLVLWECHHQANMAARRPDVENNPGRNQVNISHTQIN